MENEYLSSEDEILSELSNVSDLKGGGPILYVDEDKGDLFEYTQHFAELQNYETTILNFRDVLKSDTIDIFQYAYELYHSGNINKKQLAIEIIDAFAKGIYS